MKTAGVGKQPADQGGVDLVEPGGGLVNHHQLGLGGERAGDGHPLPLAGGEPFDALVGAVLQTHPRQPARRPQRRLVGGDPAQRKREGDVLGSAQEADQVGLLGDHRDVLAPERGQLGPRAAAELLAQHHYTPLVDRLEAGQQPQHRALARA